MKINGWIVFSLIAAFGTASSALASESNANSVQENFTQLDSAIQAAKQQVNGHETNQSFHWVELENFQSNLWRAMALDPSTVVPVPPAQVPKDLFANELNAELVKQITKLKKSEVAKEYHVEEEFSQYIQMAEKLVAQRRIRQFPQVRAFAKRGYLDSAFLPLKSKLASTNEASTSLEVPALKTIEEQAKVLRAQMSSPPKENVKKEVFTNGTQFIWVMVAAIFGFFFGLAGYRMNPDFFQKLLDQFDSHAPTATTHSAGAVKLDYARWLREFEEILSRLKSSQLTLERRIEDIVQNSEKITQHSLSLYADARIKNEANLEYRMSSLVRDVQNQFNQSQKLQAGDRIQVNSMLEHCLKLCDAIESNAIHLDRVKLSEIPEHRSA